MTRSSRSLFAAAIAIAPALVVACSAEEQSRVIGPYTLVMKSNATPALSGNAPLYEQTRAIALPLIAPPSTYPIAAGKPYPRSIWYTADDLHVQLEYVITNLTTTDASVDVTVDGWNEFIRYTPMVHIEDEEAVPDPSTIDRFIIVPAMSRVSGRIAYDDFERCAYELAMLMNSPADPYHILGDQNPLTDPINAPTIPNVIDGITGFDLSMRTTAPSELVLEATLELVDDGNHLVGYGDTSANKPPGKRYSPVAPEDSD